MLHAALTLAALAGGAVLIADAALSAGMAFGIARSPGSPRSRRASIKYALITRAAFNQGFALAHLPVRGAAR